MSYVYTYIGHHPAGRPLSSPVSFILSTPSAMDLHSFNTVTLDPTLTYHLTLRSTPKSNSNTCTRPEPATKSSPKPQQIWLANAEIDDDLIFVMAEYYLQ